MFNSPEKQNDQNERNSEKEDEKQALIDNDRDLEQQLLKEIEKTQQDNPLLKEIDNFLQERNREGEKKFFEEISPEKKQLSTLSQDVLDFLHGEEIAKETKELMKRLNNPSKETKMEKSDISKAMEHLRALARIALNRNPESVYFITLLYAQQLQSLPKGKETETARKLEVLLRYAQEPLNETKSYVFRKTIREQFITEDQEEKKPKKTEKTEPKEEMDDDLKKFLEQ